MESTPVKMNAAKLAKLATAIMGSAVLSACAQKSSSPAHEDMRRAERNVLADSRIVDTVRDSGLRSAIVSGHTLYPYHFEPEGEALNELGEKDLAVLASHLRAHPTGSLNIYRPGTDPALYEARVKSVSQALRAQGVDTDKVRLGDGPSGGGQTLSEDVLRDLRSTRTKESQEQSQSSQQYGDHSSTMSGQSSTENTSTGAQQ